MVNPSSAPTRHPPGASHTAGSGSGSHPQCRGSHRQSLSRRNSRQGSLSHRNSRNQRSPAPRRSRISNTKKRAFDDAVGRLEAKEARLPKKRRKEPIVTEKPKEETLLTAAKYFRRCISTFCSLQDVVAVGLQGDGHYELMFKDTNLAIPPPPPTAQELLEQDEDLLYDNEQDTERRKAVEKAKKEADRMSREAQVTVIYCTSYMAQCKTSWELLDQKFPDVKEFIDYCAEQGLHSQFLKTLDLMDSVATQMLYDDNVKLKGLMDKLVSPNIYTQDICVQVFSKKSKADRGLMNLVIASYWLPRKLAVDFYRAYGDRDKEKNILAQGRQILPKADACPAYLFDIIDNSLSISEDNDENERGLLKSEFLARCARVISTSKSSMYEVKTTVSSTDNAARMDMRSITPEFIAHVATLARFAMSTAETWSPRDSTFHYPSFWCNVRDVIVSGTEYFKEDLLEWWNIKVFGDHEGRVVEKMVVFEEPDEESDMDRLRRERAERKAAEQERLRLLAAQNAAEEPTGQENED